MERLCDRLVGGRVMDELLSSAKPSVQYVHRGFPTVLEKKVVRASFTQRFHWLKCVRRTSGQSVSERPVPVKVCQNDQCRSKCVRATSAGPSVSERPVAKVYVSERPVPEVCQNSQWPKCVRTVSSQGVRVRTTSGQSVSEPPLAKMCQNDQWPRCVCQNDQ